MKELKKLHKEVHEYLKTKKRKAEIEQYEEFPNKYGDNVSTFIVRYDIEDRYNYEVQRLSIDHKRTLVFIPNKGYFSFKTSADIKRIINNQTQLK
jgi:hypothetical protein